MTDLATLVVKLEAEIGQYQQQLAQASKDLKGFGAQIEEFALDIAGKFAAAFTVEKIVEFVETAVESAAELKKLSDQVGVSTEQLSAFGLAAISSGVNQDQMTSSLKKLNQAISDASGNAQSKAAYAFKALGVSVTDSNGALKTAGQLLPDIADAYQKLADGPNKVAINTELLGRQALGLISVLNQGSAGLEEFRKEADATGITMSSDLAEAAEEVEKKFILLKQEFTSGFSSKVLEEILPTLGALADGLQKISEKSGGTNALITVFGFALKQVAGFVIELETELKLIGSAFDGVIEAAQTFGKGVVQAFKDALALDPQSLIVNIVKTGGKILDVLDDQEADARNIHKAGMDAAAAVFDAGGKKLVDLSKDISTEINNSFKHAFDGVGDNVGVSPLLLQQLDEGTKKIKDFTDGLKAQSQGFGLSLAAQTRFKLGTGDFQKAIQLAQKTVDDLGGHITGLNQNLYDSAKATLNAAQSAISWANALQVKLDLKTIQDFTDKLQEQALKFGLSDVAAIDFAASIGKTGDAIKRAGDSGAIAKDHIHDLAVELADDKDKTALFSVDQQILTLQGHLADASKAAFNFSNALLIKNLQGAGADPLASTVDGLKQATISQEQYNDAVAKAAEIRSTEAAAEVAYSQAVSSGAQNQADAQKVLDDARAKSTADLKTVAPIIAQYGAQQLQNLSDLTQAQAQANELFKEAADIRAREAIAEQAIKDAVDANTETTLGGQAKIAEARQHELDQLTAIYNQLLLIPDAAKLPQVQLQIQQLNGNLKTIGTSVSELANKLQKDFVSAASDSITAFLTGTKSAKQAWSDFVGSVLSELIKLETTKLLESLLNIGGGGGSLFGAIAGVLGGGGGTAGVAGNAAAAAAEGPPVPLAGGGPVMAGMPYIVGEHGAERFVPDTDGQIVPNGDMSKAMTVYQNFTIAAPNGTVSRATQAQVAQQAGAGINRATRRNA